MALNYKTLWTGIKIKAKAVLANDTLGEIETSNITNKTYLHNGTINSPILTEASAADITNKNLVDSTTNIVDVSDPTKRINFDAAGTTGTRTTIASSQTTNKTLTLPDSTDTLVGKATTDTLTNKTFDANGTGNSISNLETADLASGVLNTSTSLSTASNTQIPSALAVKTYVDSVSNNAIQVGELVTLSGVPAHSTDLGTFTGVTIPDGSTNKQAFQALETAFEASGAGDVTGPASATDNAITRFDTTTGKLIQNSVVTVGDTGVIAGSSIDASTNTLTNISNTSISAAAAITRSKLASGTNNAVVFNNGSGVMTDSSDLTVGTNTLTLANTKHIEKQAQTDSTTTGSNASLASFTAGGVRVTNASLTSLSNIPGGVNGREFVLFNRTGVSVTIVDSSGAVGTASDRILTGSGANITLAADSALFLSYDSTTTRWQIIGGSGSGSGVATSAIDNVFNINDSTDATKQINFDAGGTTATKTTIAATQTANRTVTLPDATTTLVGTATTDTLTNKTLSGNTATNLISGAGTLTLNTTGTITVPNATDTLVGKATTDTLTNKTIVVANNTVTTAASGNLTSTNLNAALSELQTDIDFNRSQNRIFLLDDTETVSAWSTGNNATFLGGGSLSGTLANETSTPLHGTSSYKYTQAAGSLNDYFVSAAQTVDLRFRNQQTYLTIPYQYNGNTSDIQIILYDATNSAIITSTTDVVIGTNGSTSQAIVSAIIPSTCSSIRVGFQVKVLNSGKLFSFDDLNLSTDIFSLSNVANITTWQSYTPTFTGFGTVSTQSFRWRQVGEIVEIEGRFLTGSTTATEAQLTLPNGYTSSSTYVTLESVDYGASTVGGENVVSLIEPSKTYLTFGQSNTAATLLKRNGNSFTSASTLSIRARVRIDTLSAYNTSVVVPNQQVSSDTISFVFKSTALVSTDPIGSFNTYIKAATSSAGSTSIQSSAPTQTTSSMNTNGILVTATNYTTASTSAVPSRFDILIGTGLKSVSLSGFSTTGKTSGNEIVLDSALSGTTDQYGILYTYNETSGILTLEAGDNQATTITTRVYRTKVGTSAGTSGYITINASKLPSLAALPIMQIKTATISDVKANTTIGGTATTSTFNTRTLNTLVDQFSIVSSLSSNQFVLLSGTYYIEAEAVTNQTTRNKIRIRNITDTTTSIVGISGGLAANTTAINSYSTLKGTVTITGTKTFELQHYVSSGESGDGFGLATSSGESEVYSIVKITKIS